MATTPTTLLIRKDTKQAFSQAKKVSMLDSIESLKAWVEGMNTEAGWKQYAVADEVAA